MVFKLSYLSARLFYRGPYLVISMTSAYFLIKKTKTRVRQPSASVVGRKGGPLRLTDTMAVVQGEAMSLDFLKKKNKKQTRRIKEIIVYNTWCSQAVTHLSTNHARRCLTSVIGRELVFSARYGRRRMTANMLIHKWQVIRIFGRVL